MPSCNCVHERWNTTSVKDIVTEVFNNRYNLSEFNSRMECFHDFIAWYETQPDEYFPRYGLESMYSKIILRELYNYLSDLPSDQSNNNITADAFITFCNTLLDQHGRPRRW